MPLIPQASNRCALTSITSGRAHSRRSRQESTDTRNRGGNMAGTIDAAAAAPVRRSVTVNTTVERAFRIFTDDFDSWWPRTHHIGKSTMKKAIVEGRVGGRCYMTQNDGPE